MKRKSSRSLLLLVLSFAVFLILLVILFSSKEKTVQPQTVQILAAIENMNSGSVIQTSQMQWKEIPVDNLRDTFIPKTNSELMRRVEGAVVKNPIARDEIVEIQNLIDTHGRSALSAVIKDGMRAVTVPYNKLANAPSLIAPGDIIDIILPKRTSPTGREYFGETILQNIRVLAVDHSLQKTEGFDTKTTSPKSISLEVSAEQAENLAASIRDGQVVVSMHSIFSTGSQTATIKRTAEPSLRPPESQTVQIFRGSSKSQLTFEQQNPDISDHDQEAEHETK